MVDVVISRPGGGLDVTRRNKRGALYIMSDPSAPIPDDNNPDGTARFTKDPNHPLPHLEEKRNGVFNDSGMRLGPSSLGFGRNFTVGSAAHFIKTVNSETGHAHGLAFIPHIGASDTGSGFTHSPVLKNIETFPFFINPVSEEIGLIIDQPYPFMFAQIVDKIVYRTGTVSATQLIQHSIYEGTDNNGVLLGQVNLPADIFFAEPVITNVFDSVGRARFAFAPGPTLTIGQNIALNDYVTIPGYNVIGVVSSTGIGFFEVQVQNSQGVFVDLLFQGNEAGVGRFTGAIVDLGHDFGFSEEMVDVFIELGSTANFSLQTDAGGNVITTYRTQRLKNLDLLMDELVLDNNLNIVIDNDLNFVTHNRFP